MNSFTNSASQASPPNSSSNASNLPHHHPPHSHPTPQSPPGQFPMSSGASSYANVNAGNKATSPNHIPPIISTSNSIPTPSSSAAGTVPPSHEYETADQDMTDATSGSATMDGLLKRRRSLADDGDRPRKSRSSSRDLMDIDTDASNQDHSAKTALSETKKGTVPSIQELLAMPPTGPLSLLCKKKYEPANPPLTSSLFELYGLTTIAASVARVDPVTGAKKKLRKSYKGKIADLSGKIDVVAQPPQPPQGEDGRPNLAPQVTPGGLLEMMDIPEEEWYNQKVLGKELPKPGDRAAGRQLDIAALKKALVGWSKGPIPNFDASFLGIEDPSNIMLHKQASSTGAANANSPGVKSAQTPHNNVVNNLTTPGSSGSPNGGTGVSPESARLSRKKRRRYDDNSYEGYGDEFEEGDTIYDDEEDGEGKKKRKKKRRKHDYEEGGTPSAMRMPAPPPPTSRVGVGVGVGGDYYGR